MSFKIRNLLHNPVLEAIQKYSNHVAVIEESGIRITYQQLNEWLMVFSNLVNEFTEKNECLPFIGILSPVNHLSIAAVLGILNAGCAYVPLDEQSPVERLNNIIDNVKIKLLVADGALINKHPELLKNDKIERVVILGGQLPQAAIFCEKIIDFTGLIKTTSEGAKGISSRSPARPSCISDDLAYILHSSGSTGVPKGIMLSHRNARAFIDWMQKEFRLTCNDVVISRAPLKFDLSVFDIFNTLSAGATLVCFDWNKKRSTVQRHKDYVALLERERVSILYTTPSTLITLKQHGGLGQNSTSLRSIMYAGEPFPIPKLRDLMKFLPDTRFTNIYGPTETNIITCFHINNLNDIEKKWTAIPLGEVADHSEILVVDEENVKICQPGEIGELWCRGPTICQGYLNMPELTRECLIESPLHHYPGKFWKTGDYGFKDENGLLHYRGRRDHMIKIKGYRIELGEIESALATVSGIHEFCAIAKKNNSDNYQLYCFYSTIDTTPLCTKAIISQLMRKLQAYMIPSHYIHKIDLPKTSSGKVDRVFLSEEVVS